MTKEPAVLRYELDESLDSTLRALRKALKRHGLCAAFELDIAGRIREELGAGVAPRVVIYVDDPSLLLEAVVFHRGAGLLIPQPVVITGDNRHSAMLVCHPESFNGAIPESVREPFLNLHQRIRRVMESIAEKQGLRLALSS